jgi:hypothetical protein
MAFEKIIVVIALALATCNTVALRTSVNRPRSATDSLLDRSSRSGQSPP